MYNFFVNENDIENDTVAISGSGFHHIKNVLRMRIGDELLVSTGGFSHLCKIDSITDGTVFAKITERNCADTELPIELYLFQGLPKSDKMELIIQKAVELGVSEIIPVEMKRCVVRLDEKKTDAKIARWQSIAEGAAKQSKRTKIPRVNAPMSFKNAVEYASKLDVPLLPYENKEGMAATAKALEKIKCGMRVGVMIGPEGGFEEDEVEFAYQNGFEIISLGERILRTETAAITALSALMLYSEIKLK